MSKHVFCRDVCLERGEPLAGTGNAPEHILLLRWPRGKWRVPRFESIDMVPVVASAVQHAMKLGLHVALVDRVGDADDMPQLLAQPEGIAADFDSDEALAAAISTYAEGGIFAGEADARTTVLVCTDSRRDACCARYGFSTYKALDAIADKSQVNIVQATHVGGCRFAASLVVMPQRQRYGRMTAGQAPAFLEALRREEIYLPAYKGRTDQPEALQMAELAAMNWAYAHQLNPGSVELDEMPLPENTGPDLDLTIHAHITGADLTVKLSTAEFDAPGNCEILASGEPRVSRRWRLTSIERKP